MRSSRNETVQLCLPQRVPKHEHAGAGFMRPGQACKTLMRLTFAVWKLELLIIILTSTTHRNVVRKNRFLFHKFWEQKKKYIYNVTKTLSPLFPSLGTASPVSIYNTTKQQRTFHVIGTQEETFEQKQRNT